MKRLIAAFILIFLVAGLIITSTYTVELCCTSLLDTLNLCEEEFRAQKNTDPSLSQLLSKWESYEPMLMIFANHDTLEEIGYSIARVRLGDSEDFLKESAELKERINHLKISEKFTIRTIL